MSGVTDLKAIMRIRPFRRLWITFGLSAVGDWLGLLATALFASVQFDDAAAQGAAFSVVIVMRLFPSLVLGALAGVLADRWDRRVTMAVCDVLRFVLFASIPLVALWTGTGLGAAGWTAIATFLIEAVSMIWMPAKESSVPNLLPRARLETANQLTLFTTYGIGPVVGAAIMAFLQAHWMAPALESLGQWAEPAALGLYLNAITFLVAGIVVYFMIPEISERQAAHARAAAEPQRSMVRDFIDGWRYMGSDKMVRGLVLGIFGAFAGAGVIIGTGQFYARSLGGGNSTFTVLFATVFIGLGIGIAAGPLMVGQLSRRRWFGYSIVVAGVGLLINTLAFATWLAIVGTLFVGCAAGMAFLAGITLLGREVEDTHRGRMFAFIAVGAKVILMVVIAGAAYVAGFGAARRVDLGAFVLDLSFSRLLLAGAAVIAVVAGIVAFKQMDDKPGVPIFRDLWSSMRGRPLSPGKEAGGYFIVFEGGDGSGKSTQAVKLAATLRLRGLDVLMTREPGATELGKRIRSLLLNPEANTEPSPRTEALLYAADRAQHVATVLRPALDEGKIVLSDRYVDSSKAYQGSGRDLPEEEVAWLSNWATDGLKPDLVVLMDIDPKVGIARATRGAEADRLEKESQKFHEEVRYKFLDIAAEDPARYLVVDAAQDADAIAGQVLERVDTLLSGATAETEADDDTDTGATAQQTEEQPTTRGTAAPATPSDTYENPDTGDIDNTEFDTSDAPATDYTPGHAAR
ncbi:MAG TPA: dTMP kinase [Candidatus Stackebrandtia faecavium]|nr:dTMP kinase [Candidatus Stackebrandtia faecavium]